MLAILLYAGKIVNNSLKFLVNYLSIHFYSFQQGTSTNSLCNAEMLEEHWQLRLFFVGGGASEAIYYKQLYMYMYVYPP